MTKRSRRPSGRPDSGAAGTPPAAAATSSEGSATPATPRSRSASGTTRAGRRERPVRRYETRSFFDRYRTPLLIAFALAGLALIGVFVFTPRSAYACDALLTPGPTDPVPTPRPSATAGTSPSGSPIASPSAGGSPSAGASPSGAASPSPGASPSAGASPSPGASPSASPSPAAEPTQRLGFTVDDMGNVHVTSSGALQYDFCPPASGPHFNIAGQGPLRRNFYGAGTEASPGGWVHNLEHGYVVFAYSCRDGCPPEETLEQIRAAMDAAPQTPTAVACNLPNKVIAVRFDQMSTPFAAIAWDRVLLMDEWNSEAALQFAQQWIESPQVPEPNAC